MSRQSSTKSERRKRLDKRRAQRRARDVRFREMLDGYLAIDAAARAKALSMLRGWSQADISEKLRYPGAIWQ